MISKNMILDMDNASKAILSERMFKDVFKTFQAITKSPEAYLSVQNEKAEKSKEILKSLFDCVRAKNVFVGNQVPLRMAVAHMDEEQIWQQMELLNEYLWSTSIQSTSRLLAATDEKFSLNYKKAGESSDDNDGSEVASIDGIKSDEDGVSDEGSDEDNDSDNESPSKEKPEKNRSQKSIVDDKFFRLSEMEAFLDAEDKKEMRKNNGTLFQSTNDEIDYFNGDFSEDGGDENEAEANAKYWSFFDGDSEDEQEIRRRKREERNLKNKITEKRKKEDLGLDDSDIDDVGDEDVEELEEEEEEGEGNSEDDEDMVENRGKVKFDLSKNDYRSDSEEDEDGEEEDDDKESDLKTPSTNEDKSSFELRQERLRNRINEFEEAALGEKAWQLKGEITSTSRPQNSLLEEVLEFDSTTRAAPVITEETTLQLEDIIKQRIKDKAWNDVERKYKPANTPQEFRKKLVLDQEKSKESLAQIYEKEYLKEIEKLDPNAGDKVEEEPKEHKEIRDLMKTLFVKLDALSNFYYTPKPAAPEIKIITNTPAINMEEVAPTYVSDAALLAPEEIRPRAKGEVKGKSERTSTDKKRERRMKKLKQKSIHIAKEKRAAEKEKQGISLSSKEERERLMKKITKSRNVQKIKETTDGRAIKSSKAFFSQLQDEVTVNMKSKRKQSRNDEAVNAKKLKL